MLHTFALWGLVTNYGKGGRVSEVLPLQKMGAGWNFFLAVLNGGGTKSLRYF